MRRPEKVVSDFRRGGWHQTHQEWRQSASRRVVRSMWARLRHKQNLSVTQFRTTLLLRRRPHEPAQLAKLYRVTPFPRQPQSTASEHCSLDRYFSLPWQWNVIVVVVVVAYFVYVSCMCEIKTRLWKHRFIRYTQHTYRYLINNVIRDDIQIRVPIRR